MYSLLKSKEFCSEQSQCCLLFRRTEFDISQLKISQTSIVEGAIFLYVKSELLA